MRLLEFRASPDAPVRVGAIDRTGTWVIDPQPSGAATSLGDLLAEPDGLTRFVELAEHGASSEVGARHSLAEVEFAPLLGDGGRVFAIGLNYEKIYPAGKAPPRPTHPPWFAKLAGTLVGHEQPIVAPAVSPSFDYEVELAAVIGARGRHVPVDRALDLVAGWTCVNDGSVREWQRHSVDAGKNFERSGSIGPWMITADEIPDPHNLALTSRVDGEVRQSANTGDMIFDVAEIIAYLSQALELRPGDVIATGSPEGSGGSFDPPRFLEPGQVVEVEVEAIGVLRNPVIAE